MIRAGGDPHSLHVALQAKLKSLPKQDPAPPKPGYSASCLRIFQTAAAIRNDMGDTHIAQDHLFLALLKDVESGPVIEATGVTISSLEDVIETLRARDRPDDESDGGGGVKSGAGAFVEETYDALEKYGLDLTELAATGKLDPVIVRAAALCVCCRCPIAVIACVGNVCCDSGVTGTR